MSSFVEPSSSYWGMMREYPKTAAACLTSLAGSVAAYTFFPPLLGGVAGATMAVPVFTGLIGWYEWQLKQEGAQAHPLQATRTWKHYVAGAVVAAAVSAIGCTGYQIAIDTADMDNHNRLIAVLGYVAWVSGPLFGLAATYYEALNPRRCWSQRSAQETPLLSVAATQPAYGSAAAPPPVAGSMVRLF